MERAADNEIWFVMLKLGRGKANTGSGCVLSGLLTRSDLEPLANDYGLDMIESDKVSQSNTTKRELPRNIPPKTPLHHEATEPERLVSSPAPASTSLSDLTATMIHESGT